MLLLLLLMFMLMLLIDVHDFHFMLTRVHDCDSEKYFGYDSKDLRGLPRGYVHMTVSMTTKPFCYCPPPALERACARSTPFRWNRGKVLANSSDIEEFVIKIF